MTWKKEKTEGYILNKVKNLVQKYFSEWEMKDIIFKCLVTRKINLLGSWELEMGCRQKRLCLTSGKKQSWLWLKGICMGSGNKNRPIEYGKENCVNLIVNLREHFVKSLIS